MIINNNSCISSNAQTPRYKNEALNATDAFEIKSAETVSTIAQSSISQDMSHYDVFEQMTGQRVNNNNYDFHSHWEWYLKQFGIDNVTLNPNSKGDQELTEEQISVLKKNMM